MTFANEIFFITNEIRVIYFILSWRDVRAGNNTDEDKQKQDRLLVRKQDSGRKTIIETTRYGCVGCVGIRLLWFDNSG